MNLHPPVRSVKSRKRVGRGQGTGNGCTSGRGTKGQKSRSGYSEKIGFEGGQMPLSRRVPKRGFTNKTFKKEYQIVNVGMLDKKFNDGDTVDYSSLIEKGLISRKIKYVKILGEGELTKKLKVVVDKISEKAKEIIEKAGGTVELHG